MLEELDKIQESFQKEIGEIQNQKDLENLRIKYLGRKGLLTQILRSLKDLSLEERRIIGEKANYLKEKFEIEIEEKKERLSYFPSEIRLDVTKPGKKIEKGTPHPLAKIEEEICEIFKSLNFSIVESPEVESEYYNFDALNIPPNHPARDMWDTFWLKDFQSKSPKNNLLLRTHTSPAQIRYMEKNNPPFQIIVPGRVFRYEATDASHEINFYQVEGLMVGPKVSLANFKFIIEAFLKKFFGSQIQFRYRPSYFPFVEPGLEVDIKFSQGKWLEIMGAGMVHQKVFEIVRYNPKEVQGFAFGLGLDRLAMIKYKIPDIRLFYSGDLRFIKQFY